MVHVVGRTAQRMRGIMSRYTSSTKWLAFIAFMSVLTFVYQVATHGNPF